MEKTFDVVVIGAGSGGLTAAVGFAKAGKSVLLIEREHLGGECTNSGCIPSKALLHHAKAYHQATAIAGTNTQTEAYRKNAFGYVREKIAEVLAEETPAAFEAMGITVVIGEAEFTAPCQVRVGDTVYRFKRAVIATGSSPRHLDIPGLSPEQVLTNQNLFTLEQVPQQTLIIGAGPIGLEMGQALAMLGSRVTIATIDSKFARLEDPAIAEILRERFTSLGIVIELGANIKNVEDVEAVFERKEGEMVTETFRVPFDKVLVAVGRVPNVPPGLAVAGIKADERCVMVDSQYRTSNRYVYAIGDVAQRLKFTHTADDVARQVVARVLSRGLLRVNTRKAVPKVTYTLPEVAQVGLSWQAALLKYGEEGLMRIEVPFTKSDRAKTDDDTKGLLVVIARRLNGAVLGAHIIGPAAGEIISLFTLAIDRNISLWKLRSLIYAYPTYSLMVKKAGDQFLAAQLRDLRSDLMRTFQRQAPKVIALIVGLVLIVGFQVYRDAQGLTNIQVLLQFANFLSDSFWGPIAYIALYTVRPLILFPGILLTILAGILFGLPLGLLYTVIGATASAAVAYWIGRFFGRDLRLEDSVIGNWVEALRARPFGTVLFMRLFYVPFDVTNYGAGMLRIRWQSYLIATVIGIIPGSATFVALGAAIDLHEFAENGISFNALDPAYLALAVCMFVVSLGLARVLRRWRAV